MSFGVVIGVFLLTAQIVRSQTTDDFTACSAQANNNGPESASESCGNPASSSPAPTGFRKPMMKCPQGTTPIASQGLQPFRCVRMAAVKTARNANANVVAVGYIKYAVADEFVCLYPRAMSPHDEWNDDVPTLSFLLDSQQSGKPVAVTITKFAKSQASYVAIPEAIAKDKNWLKAKELAPMTVSGIKTRVTVVRGASKTAYVPIDDGAYYAITYSAPKDAYDEFVGVFEKMLDSFSISRATN